jgi:hypothetical protein
MAVRAAAALGPEFEMGSKCDAARIGYIAGSGRMQQGEEHDKNREEITTRTGRRSRQEERQGNNGKKIGRI